MKTLFSLLATGFFSGAVITGLIGLKGFAEFGDWQLAAALFVLCFAGGTFCAFQVREIDREERILARRIRRHRTVTELLNAYRDRR